MSREAKIRATAGALQAKSFDLAALRQRSVRDSDFKVRAEDAAGALAYSGHGSDPLPALLLRLKYAKLRSSEGYKAAQAILLRRYGGLARPPSLIMGAVAMAAVFEWVNDACQKCRVGDNGRLFQPGRRDRGIRCLTCNGTGRITFDPRQRAMAVSELVAVAQEARGERRRGLAQKRFSAVWQAKYWRFVDVLRLVDKHEVGALAFGFRAIHTAPIETEPIEEDQPSPGGTE